MTKFSVGEAFIIIEAFKETQHGHQLELFHILTEPLVNGGNRLGLYRVRIGTRKVLSAPYNRITILIIETLELMG